MNDAAVLEARSKAEASVSDMPDGPLKIAAFQVILGRLLDAAAGGAGAFKDETAAVAVPKTKQTNAATAAVPKSLAERILLLREEQFFAKERGIGDVRDELKIHGWVYPVTSLSGALQGLVQQRLLRRAMVSNGKKKIFKYVNP